MSSLNDLGKLQNGLCTTSTLLSSRPVQFFYPLECQWLSLSDSLPLEINIDNFSFRPISLSESFLLRKFSISSVESLLPTVLLVYLSCSATTRFDFLLIWNIVRVVVQHCPRYLFLFSIYLLFNSFRCYLYSHVFLSLRLLSTLSSIFIYFEKHLVANVKTLCHIFSVCVTGNNV